MINIIDTPNPDTKKFVFEFQIVKNGSMEFKKNEETEISLVKGLFNIGNIDLVYFGNNFISIRKSKDISWEDITQNIIEYLKKKIDKNFLALNFEEESNFTDEVSMRIEEVLSEKIRPAVAMDGGDIRLRSFKNGVAEVILKGACAGCPSSTVTLKHGVERMLRHYVPEVSSVEAFDINE
ncbi:MAG: hypothetical protein CMI85_00645 [Candidatus Pelagibacter sp.]|nr:hypothetical protein [Candidatus Pelagibacter sp.]|tara:strand:- start:16821 stop:17360 length:540 start_codon:yes stop_codon:yes gene_type:complete